MIVLLDTADDVDGKLPHECTRRRQAVAHQEHGEQWRDCYSEVVSPWTPRYE